MLEITENWRKFKADMRPQVVRDPSVTKAKLAANKQTDYYNESFEFRMITQILMVHCDIYLHDFHTAINNGNKIIELLTDTEYLELLAEAYNVTGLAFLSVEMANEVIHCYSQVIRLETTTGLTNLTSIAYNNIGAIYDVLDNVEKSQEYYQLALEHLQRDDVDQKACQSLNIYILCNLVIRHSLSDNCYRVPVLIEQIEQIDLHADEIKTHRHVNLAKMVVAMKCHNTKRGAYYYHETVRYLKQMNDLLSIVDVTGMYCRLCIENARPYEEFIQYALNLIDTDVEQTVNKDMYHLFEIAIDYFCSIGEDQKALIYYKKLREHANAYQKFIVEQQAIAVAVREDLERLKLESTTTKEKNEELKLLTREAIDTKNKLQSAYEKIQAISIFGQQITSTSNLHELAQLVYSYVHNNMHLTAFIIMVKEVSSDQLTSAIMYENGEEQSQISLSLDRSESLVVQCFQSAEQIVSGDIYHDARFVSLINSSSESLASVVYLPIEYEANPIGVLTVQSKYKDIYSDDDIEFLISILPYLSIAINNVNHSTVLYEEIVSHKQTQRELKALNDHLERLSSLDGLTKVNNRRAFDMRYLELIGIAEDTGESIAVIMLDIDFFKQYNDNYGHLKGDDALIKVAQKINLAFQSDSAVFARFGGEEFIAVFKGLTEVRLMRLCEQIRVAIANMTISNEHTPSGYLTISIGAAQSIHASVDDKSMLMKLADDALYAAKAQGRNRVEYHKIG